MATAVPTGRYSPLTVREIEPRGWLLRQLRIQADGLSGHLDEVWPDVRDSRWIGGDREGWERVPYWLDGFIPLAYLLRDTDMQARAKRYIDAILAGQQADGWICPCGPEERDRYDVWAVFLICKVLVLYHDCTGDARIEGAVYRALRNLQDHIHMQTLFNWGQSRWFEALIPLFWLYDRTPEDWMLRLAMSLYTQGLHYRELFDHWQDQAPRREWTHQTHVVNLAMALKAEALIGRITGADGDAFARRMLDQLTASHGTCTGHFTGDECLSGTSPIQGTELCGVVEAMYSYEVLFAQTGRPDWLDRLEMLAFNALPAAISPDMWTHQYDQMANQIACVPIPGRSIFGTNPGDSHVFGLEPNYGCCTANFNQGWPKFALSTFLRSETGLVSAALAPAAVTMTLNGAPVSVELATDYPFRSRLVYTVRTAAPTAFDLDIRIPACAAGAAVDGTPVPVGAFHRVRRVWNGTETVTVELRFVAAYHRRPADLVCLRRGPLLYALPLAEQWTTREYTRDDVERKAPYCDYELTPLSPWNYAFAGGDIAVEEHAFGAPFSTERPPVTLRASLVPIDWGTEPGYDTVCAREPRSRAPLGPPQEMVLMPYGCTNLRMTELPLLAE